MLKIKYKYVVYSVVFCSVTVLLSRQKEWTVLTLGYLIFIKGKL